MQFSLRNLSWHFCFYCFFYCKYPTSLLRGRSKGDGREGSCPRQGFGAGASIDADTTVAPNAISPASHTLAGLLFSGTRQQDTGTLLRLVPRAGGRMRMFWRKYSTSEAVTAGNASGGTAFALSGSFLPCEGGKEERGQARQGCDGEGGDICKCWTTLVRAREKASPQHRVKFPAGRRT